MRKIMLCALGTAACALMLAPIAGAAEKPSAAVQNTKATAAKTAEVWPAETLSGKIMTVDPAANLVIVKGPDGVPFDMRVTPSTRISSAGARVTLKDLQQDQKKNVSVKFVPKESGDIARSIQVAG